MTPMRSMLPALRRGAVSLLVLLAGAAGATPAATPVDAWPPFPTPAGASVSWVAENMRYNNVPMQIRMMQSSDSPARILAFYRERWKDAGGKTAETRLSPWTILALASGPFQFTVETREVKGGSESVLTISRLPEMVEKARQSLRGQGPGFDKPGHGFPMMSGSRVHMDMESFDEGRQGRMIMHRNSFPVEDNALYLREQLLLHGWTRNKDNRSPDGRSRTLVFRRGSQELVLTLSRNGSQTEILSSQTDAN